MPKPEKPVIVELFSPNQQSLKPLGDELDIELYSDYIDEKEDELYIGGLEN